MARFEELNEQQQQQWLARSAQERQKLSASVEEALDIPMIDDDQWDDEEEEDVEPPVARKATLVPPRLSLQSRQIPVVQSVQPKTPFPVELSPASRKRQRLAGFTTKVRLQTVPKSEPFQRPVEPLPLYELPTRPGLRVVQTDDLEPDRGDRNGNVASPVASQTGMGVFEIGQGEAIVMNSCITPASVVMVTLTGDPGPVVVQYVTLRPSIGFTVHLSAPTRNRTPFNYAIF